jgi:hypothetical protein
MLPVAELTAFMSASWVVDIAAIDYDKGGEELGGEQLPEALRPDRGE